MFVAAECPWKEPDGPAGGKAHAIPDYRDSDELRVLWDSKVHDTIEGLGLCSSRDVADVERVGSTHAGLSTQNTSSTLKRSPRLHTPLYRGLGLCTSARAPSLERLKALPQQLWFYPSTQGESTPRAQDLSRSQPHKPQSLEALDP